MAGINHTLEYYCERYIEKPTCARYDALAEKVVNLSEGKITRVTRCSECKHFYPFFDPPYGKCSRRHYDVEVVKTTDYCSYGESPLPVYDDHEVSGAAGRLGG